MNEKILTGQDVAKIMQRYIDEIEKDPSFELYVSLTPAIPPGTEDVFDDIFGENGKSAYKSFMSDSEDQKDFGGELKKQIYDVRKGLDILSDIRAKGLDIAYIGYSTNNSQHTHIMFYKDGAMIEFGMSPKEYSEIDPIFEDIKREYPGTYIES